MKTSFTVKTRYSVRNSWEISCYGHKTLTGFEVAFDGDFPDLETLQKAKKFAEEYVQMKFRSIVVPLQKANPDWYLDTLGSVEDRFIKVYLMKP